MRICVNTVVDNAYYVCEKRRMKNNLCVELDG